MKPIHAAIIMDGNGRWAQQRGLPRLEGHRRGVETVRTIVDATRELGIRCVTLYAFSVENWKRPASEVGMLMQLLKRYLRSELKTLLRHDIRFHVVGRSEHLPRDVQDELTAAVDRTARNAGMQFNIALNYGGRAEIVDAAKRAIRDGVKDHSSEHFQILSVHLALLEDSMLVDQTIRLIRENQYKADWAFNKVLQSLLETFHRIEDQYLRERGHDLRQIGHRVLENLAGRPVDSISSIREPMVVIVGLIVLFIIVNTIRLAVVARGPEIEIMRLVGASDAFIRWPFILEGALVGAFGALITLGLLAVAAGPLESFMYGFFRVLPLEFGELARDIAILVSATGLGLGVFGSWLSVRSYLRA